MLRPARQEEEKIGVAKPPSKNKITARAWQRMLSGRRLNLVEPSPLDIEITDIALQEGEQLVGTGPVAAGDTVLVAAGTYTLTQADVDAGYVANTATASDGSVSVSPRRFASARTSA